MISIRDIKFKNFWAMAHLELSGRPCILKPIWSALSRYSM
jgi:hypothetical protein